MRKYICLAMILLSGCGSDSSQPGSDGYPHFKLWTNPVNGHVINMSGIHYGQNPQTFAVNGKTCHCKLAVAGWTNIGSVELRLCAKDGILQDADCTALEFNSNYELIDNSLKVCPVNGGACAVYY